MPASPSLSFSPAVLATALALAVPIAGAQGVNSGCLSPLPVTAPLAADLPLHLTYSRADSVERFQRCTGDEFRLIPASARLFSRSGVPDGRGAGAAPATIGSTAILRAGAEFRIGRVQARLAPELTVASNSDFQIFPGRDGSRSSFSSPFYLGEYSADLPLRPGDATHLRLDLGESGLWWIGSRASAMVSTALPDWGPGVGEGVVFGRSTAGLPRLELSTWRPVKGGLLRARWLEATALESRFFDANADNNQRGVAGIRVTYEREHWTLGASRTVMDGRHGTPVRFALAPLQRSRSDSLMELLAADFLYANRERGSYAWFEGVRQIPIRSWRDLTLMPTEGLALRVGASQRLVVTTNASWVLGAEVTRLDQPRQRAGRAPQDLYTSPTVAQGWTHRGQPLGSGLGPGGQRQYLSLDRETSRWRVGGFLERARWNDDAMYREFLPYQTRHDVTLQGGLRGGWRLRSGQSVDVSVSAGQRLNYLFQNATYLPGYRTQDLRFAEASLTVRP